MKCPNCGAEIENSAKACQYCGSGITPQMASEQERINKAGCPRCGSTNVTFNRERRGEVKAQNRKSVIYATVGVCKDCGNTWYTQTTEPAKQRKTWLWVLGWIFIFPVPLTILLLRKKEMKPAWKYGIIAAAWLVFLVIALSGGNNSDAETGSRAPADTAPIAIQAESMVTEATDEPTKEAATAPETEAPTEDIPETTAETTTVPETETKPATDPTEEKTTTDDNFNAILSLIETTALQNFDYHKIEGDVTGVTIYIGNDGLSQAVTLAKSLGKGADYEDWVTVKDNLCQMCKSVQELLATLGYEDTLVMVNVVNDVNTDNILLSILNGVVWYDVMAE